MERGQNTIQDTTKTNSVTSQAIALVFIGIVFIITTFWY